MADGPDESQRLESFADWPKSSPVKAKDLARDGFRFTGTGDRVKCCSCGLVLEGWEKGDVPCEEHWKQIKECEFAREPAEGQGRTAADSDVFDPPNYGGPEPTKFSQPLTCMKCKRRDRSIKFEPCCCYVVCEPCSRDLSRCPKCQTDITAKDRFPPRS